MIHPSRSDLDNIHRNVLRVLAEVGLRVENNTLLDALAGVGAEVDGAKQVARFPARVVEDFLAACPKIDWARRRSGLTVRASLYAGKYLDPRTNELVTLTPKLVEEYLTLARHLPNVGGTMITGCPWGPSAEREPLYERLYCWKLGAAPSGILYPHAQAPRLLELYEAYAQLKGKPVGDVFTGGVFMQSPLRFSAEEAEQFVWWWSRGFRVGIAHMTTAGLTGPVTPAGLVALHLAEAIAIALIDKACYGGTWLGLAAMLAPLDMRTMMRPYGRPEMAVQNRLFTEMARYYGFSCFVHSGVSDAKRPSCEAGAQKMMTTLSALLSGADAFIDAGLLAGDCIFSPIQMIFDNEMAGALRTCLRSYDCSDEAIGFDAIAEAGPGGLFSGIEHTVRHFRDEVWEPSIWAREPLEAWIAEDGRTDLERALDLYEKIVAEARPEQFLTPDQERSLRQVIEKR